MRKYDKFNATSTHLHVSTHKREVPTCQGQRFYNKNTQWEFKLRANGKHSE